MVLVPSPLSAPGMLPFCAPLTLKFAIFTAAGGMGLSNVTAILEDGLIRNALAVGITATTVADGVTTGGVLFLYQTILRSVIEAESRSMSPSPSTSAACTANAPQADVVTMCVVNTCDPLFSYQAILSS